MAKDSAALFETLLRLGDTMLISGQRLSEWCARAPAIELDIALQNQALDLIGQARLFLDYAAKVEGKGNSEDDLAYFRDETGFRNLLICEQPRGDFAVSMVRQMLFSVFMRDYCEGLTTSADETLAAIAQKAVKEQTYHARYTSEWVVRLGDGTRESHARAQKALDELWPYSHEFFETDGVDDVMIAARITPDARTLQNAWHSEIEQVVHRATLTLPQSGWQPTGGRSGRHTEHLGYILAEMQVLARAHPGVEW